MSPRDQEDAKLFVLLLIFFVCIFTILNLAL